MGVALGGHPRALEALEEGEIRLEKLRLVVGIVSDVVAVAAEIEPVDGAAIPQGHPPVLAARPIGSAVAAIAGKQLRQECPSSAMPWHLGDVGSEQLQGAAGGLFSVPDGGSTG